LKKVITVIIMTFLVFSFAGITFSSEKGKKMEVFAGLIKAIDTKERTVTLKNDKAPEFTCIVNDKTAIRLNSEIKSFADIRTGNIAVAVYESINGKNVARSVTIMPPAAASSSAGQSKP
jgi:hypothetical protein